MTQLIRCLAGALVALLLGGCGSSGDNTDSTGPGSSTADPTGTATAASATPASTPHGRAIVSVSYRRSGGLKPSPVARVFTADERPPKGFTAAERDSVLRAAQAFVRSGDQVARLPHDTCCDRYVYAVRIAWSDGSSLTFATIDGLDQPRPFDALLGLLA